MFTVLQKRRASLKPEGINSNRKFKKQNKNIGWLAYSQK
jgi:hypothetical protein